MFLFFDVFKKDLLFVSEIIMELIEVFQSRLMLLDFLLHLGVQSMYGFQIGLY